MFEIVNGSLEKIKAELKKAKQLKVNEVKDVKKQIKTWKDREKKAAKEEKRGENIPPKEFDRKIEGLEKIQDVYSSYIPVRVGNLMIDYKIFQAALKKLKDLEIDIKVSDQEMILSYKTNYSKGSVHLHDISKYFKDFQHVPEMRVQADG